jgi:hypothetical protein
MEQLNAGMQHSIEKPIEQYWNDLIIETEQAIRKLETRAQDAYRIMATKKLEQMRHSSNLNDTYPKRQTHPEKHTEQTEQRECNDNPR